jgi:hypothetical protein
MIRREWRAIAILAVVALAILARQFVQPALYGCMVDDNALLRNWSRQFLDALRDGFLWPRWLPDSHGGYGSPTFVFYAPLTHWLLAGVQLLGADIAWASAWVRFGALLGSGLGVYVLGAARWGRGPGLLAAAFAMALPFRVFDLYAVGVFQSKIAVLFFPFVLVAAHRLATSGAGIVPLAISIALVTLSHVLSGYIAILLTAVYVLVLAESRARALARFAVAVALGLALAGAYLVPALVESRYVHLDWFREQTWGRFENNFLFWIATAVPEAARTDYHSQIRTNVLLSLGLAAIVPLASGLGARPHRRELAATFAALGTAVFLMSSASMIVWRWLPGLQLVLFSARFANYAVVLAAVAIGISLTGAPSLVRRVGLACSLLLIALQGATLVRRGCAEDPNALGAFGPDYDVVEYTPATVPLEWLNHPWARPEIELTPPGNAHITRTTAHERVYEVDTTGAARARLRLFSFPGWRMELDGSPVDHSVEPESGAVLIDVPSGAHTIRAVFGSTWDRGLGWAISLVAALLLGVLASRSNRA